MNNVTKYRFTERTLGYRVMKARTTLGISQMTLAEKIGISQSSVSKIENNEPVEGDLLVKLARALAVPKTWLLFGVLPLEVDLYMGRLLKKTLDEKSISIDAFGSMMGWNSDFIHNIFDGKVHLSNAQVQRMCATLNLPEDRFSYRNIPVTNDNNEDTNSLTLRSDIIHRIILRLNYMGIDIETFCKETGCDIQNHKDDTVEMDVIEAAAEMLQVTKQWIEHGSVDSYILAPNPDYIRKYLSEIMLERKWTEVEFAELTGVDLKKIKKSNKITESDLKPLSDYLGISMTKMLYDIGNTKPDSELLKNVEEINVRIRDMMVFRDISRRDISKKSQMSPGNVERILRVPSYRVKWDDITLSGISVILNCDYKWILTGDGDAPYDHIETPRDFGLYVRMIRYKKGIDFTKYKHRIDKFERNPCEYEPTVVLQILDICGIDKQLIDQVPEFRIKNGEHYITAYDSEKHRKQFGQRVKEARMLKGITEGELGDALSIHQSTVHNIESAKNLSVPISVDKIAKALDVDVEFLLNGEIHCDTSDTNQVIQLTKDICDRIRWRMSFVGLHFTDINKAIFRRRSDSFKYDMSKLSSVHENELQRISEVLGVDLQWIVSGSDDNDSIIAPDPEIIVDSVIALMKASKMTNTRFYTATGVNVGMLKKMRRENINGKCLLKTLADKFQISPEDILQKKFDNLSLVTNGMELINRIKGRLAYFKMSIKSLATYINLTYDKVRSALNGDGDDCIRDSIREVAECLKCDAEYLLTGEPDPYVNFNSTKDLSAYLRAFRAMSALTAYEVAQRGGFDINAIAIYENMTDERSINTSTLVQLLKAYGIDPKDLSQRFINGEINTFNNRYKSIVDFNRSDKYNISELTEVVRSRLMEAREAKGYSRMSLAHALGYKSYYPIRDFELGLTDQPHFSIEEVSEILGVSVDWLLGGSESPEPTESDKLPNSSSSEYIVEDGISTEYNTSPSELEIYETDFENCEIAESGGSVNLDERPLMTAITTELVNFDEDDLIKIYERILELKTLREYEKMKRGE